jgi:hypothetical protein
MTRERRIQLHNTLLNWLQNQRRPVTVFQLEDFRLALVSRFPGLTAAQVMWRLEQMIAAGEVRETVLRGFSIAGKAGAA